MIENLLTAFLVVELTALLFWVFGKDTEDACFDTEDVRGDCDQSQHTSHDFGARRESREDRSRRAEECACDAIRAVRAVSDDISEIDGQCVGTGELTIDALSLVVAIVDCDDEAVALMVPVTACEDATTMIIGVLGQLYQQHVETTDFRSLIFCGPADSEFTLHFVQNSLNKARKDGCRVLDPQSRGRELRGVL